MKIIYKILDDDGVFLITIPNKHSYQIVTKGVPCSLCYGQGTHLQFFARGTIKKMLLEAGFKNIKRVCWFEKKKGLGFIAETIKWLFRKLGISTELRYVIKKNI